jgi:hypothetical protein
MATATNTFKAGQSLVCTISKVPVSQDDRDTIARLMRLDPANKKSLRKAQRMRRQRMVIYNRGNRDWVKREHPAKVVYVAPGKTWNLPYTLDLAGDIRKVEKFVKFSAK